MGYIDGTSAINMLDNVFEVLEGGGEVASSNIVEFVADNGTKIADITTHEVTATNGLATEVAEVVSVESGATAGTATGAGIFTAELGVAGMGIATALGVVAGAGLYALAPEFWQNVSYHLTEAGKTVGGKVVGFVDKNGVTSFDKETIEIFKNALLEAGVFSPQITYPQTPAIGSGYTLTTGGKLEDIINTALNFASANGWSSGDVSNLRNQFAQILAEVTNDAPNLLNAIWQISLLKNQPTRIYRCEALAKKINNIYYPDTAQGYVDNEMFAPVYVVKNITNPFHYWSSGGGLLDIAWWSFGEPTFRDGDNELFVSNANITEIPPTLQSDATYPEQGIEFPLTYPNWQPAEFPEPLPAEMPDKYPLSLPDPDATQDPAQTGENASPEQQDNLVKIFFNTLPDPDPHILPDPDPSATPEPEPAPEPQPEPNPSDPNPDPTPSGATIALPTLDTVSASRMFTVYNPTDAQVNSLGAFLWTNNIMEQIKKLWENPMDGIISFHRIYGAPVTGTSKNIVLGYIDSGVSALEVTNQFCEVDCGTVHVPERLHNATDYSPFTTLHIYLPFVGIVELDTNECMNGELHVKYRIDTYTGTCVALIYLQRDVDMPNEQIIYTFSGNASQKLPLTASDFGGAISSLLSLAGAGVAVASGGSLGAVAGALGVAHSLTSEMVHIQHSGGLSANAGILSPRVPYLILSRQYGYDANGYNGFHGYPANKTVYIGNCNGFIKCKDVIFRGSCTEEEANEINRLLKEGVYT